MTWKPLADAPAPEPPRPKPAEFARRDHMTAVLTPELGFFTAEEVVRHVCTQFQIENSATEEQLAGLQEFLRRGLLAYAGPEAAASWPPGASARADPAGVMSSEPSPGFLGSALGERTDDEPTEDSSTRRGALLVSRGGHPGVTQNVIFAASWMTRASRAAESAPKLRRGFERFCCGISTPFVKL